MGGDRTGAGGGAEEGGTVETEGKQTTRGHPEDPREPDLGVGQEIRGRDSLLGASRAPHSPFL